MYHKQEYAASFPQNQRALWTALEQMGLLEPQELYTYVLCKCYKPFRGDADVCTCGLAKAESKKTVQFVDYADVVRSFFAVPDIACHATYAHDRFRTRPRYPMEDFPDGNRFHSFMRQNPDSANGTQPFQKNDGYTTTPKKVFQKSLVREI